MDASTKITSKGQATIPKSVRNALGSHEGDELLCKFERPRAVVAKAPDSLAWPASDRTVARHFDQVPIRSRRPTWPPISGDHRRRGSEPTVPSQTPKVS